MVVFDNAGRRVWALKGSLFRAMVKGRSNKGEPKGGDSLTHAAAAVSVQTSNKIVICTHQGCHDIATTKEMCRFHYLASWRKIKGKEAKKHGKALDEYLRELSKKFPEEFLVKLRADLEEMSEKEEGSEGDDSQDRSSAFDQIDDDEDLDHIVHGLKVEDY